MSRPSRNDANASGRPLDEGVSADERSVLGELTGLDIASRSSSPEPVEPPREPRPTPPAPAPEPVSPLESPLRNALLRESERIVREDLPVMFPQSRPTLPEFDDDPLAFISPSDRPAPVPDGSAARLFRFLSAPARRLGPAVVTALGLAGVLLLIALLVVILVGVLTRT